MLCFYIVNNTISYVKYCFSESLIEIEGHLPIHSANFVYLKSFSIDTNKFLLSFCEDYHVIGVTLELSENNIIIVDGNHIGHIYQPDSVILDCLLINKIIIGYS